MVTVPTPILAWELEVMVEVISNCRKFSVGKCFLSRHVIKTKKQPIIAKYRFFAYPLKTAVPQSTVFISQDKQENRTNIIFKLLYLLRRTTQGMPIRSAAATPDWLPATRTQLWTGTSAYSAAALRVAIVFCNLYKPQTQAI